MKKIIIVALVTLLIGGSVLVVTGEQAMAKKAKDVIWALAGPMYPEAGEAFGLNMYVSSLVGLTQQHPALKGKINIKIYDKGMLHKTMEDTLLAMKTGAVQMSYGAPQFLEQFAREWKVIQTPGVFQNYEHFVRAMETKPWKALHKKMEDKYNITILKWVFSCGNWHLFSSKGPLKTMENIKGQKIRFAGGKGFSKALEALGAGPVGLPYTEVITALQTHMIDGMLTSLSAARAYYKLDRYCPYVNLIPFTIMPFCFVVNSQWYNSLRPEMRKAVYAPFDRIDIMGFYTRLREKNVQIWRDDPKTTVIEYNEGEASRWRQAMLTATKETLSTIDPIFLKAVEETR